MTSTPPKSLKEIIKANNKFAVKIYQELAKNNKDNLLLSPLAVETSLAFLLSACKKDVCKEILQCFCLPKDMTTVYSGMKQLFVQLDSYNLFKVIPLGKLYVAANSPINKIFKKFSVQTYNTDVDNVNFDKKYYSARTMNDWVKEQTKNNMVHVFDYNNMQDNISSILVNVLYLKANWNSPFPYPNTRNGYFYKSSDILIPMETMFAYEKQFNYCESFVLKAKILEVPFIGEQGSLTVVLPNKIDGLAYLEKRIEKVFGSFRLKTQLVSVALPKFKINNVIDMKANLQNMGINNIFNKKEAFLKGITNDGDIFISDMAQAAYIDVSEDGIDAAEAASVFVVLPLHVKNKRPKAFIADHPFLFYVKVESAIVLAGRVLEPY